MLTMTRAIICKLLQRRTYDILSQKYSFLIFILCLVGLVISGFRFGEVVIEWSKTKHSQMFDTYVDNIMGKSYQDKLCQYLPIDVVYTWVNGSDTKLLADLAKAKVDYEERLNDSTHESFYEGNSPECPYSYCLESHMVLMRPHLPDSVTLAELAKAHFVFNNAKKIVQITAEQIKEMKETSKATIIVMDSKESANLARRKGIITIGGVDYNVYAAFITSDHMAPYSIKMKDTIIMTGVPGQLKEDEVLRKMPLLMQHHVKKLFLYSDVSAAVMLVADQDALQQVLKLEGNFTIQNRAQTLRAANLLLHIPKGIVNEDVSSSRFQDNEELRYSLRSLEKFAPWVRQIFIVTNGQIPSWLNLENPRVTVISHEELFPIKSHLPTFSSPSIETHLHRIPGLSKKFLYLNDDVVFGKAVWPEDFYTATKGHKVYLSWAVPDCRDGCPSSWIGDGYCDKPCNNSDCEWDGSDCKDGLTGMRFLTNQNIKLWREESDKLYCSANCANSWLADRYCDQACNVLECTFDMGDCGTSDYDKLHGFELNSQVDSYTVPNGVVRFYFNLTDFLVDRIVREGNYEENAAIRVIAINQKFKIITAVLYRNHSTTLSLSVKGLKNNADYDFKISIAVDTNPAINNAVSRIVTKELPTPKRITTLISTTTATSTIKPTIKIVPDELKRPKIIQFVPKSEYEKYEKVNFTAVNFSRDILNELNELSDSFKKKFLTEKGYKIKKSHVIGNYLKELRNTNQTEPILVDLIENHNDTDGNSVTLRKLKGFVENEHKMMLEVGAFPWEKKRIFYSLTQANVNIKHGQRRLFDTFGDSLRHVNRLLNREFGYESRKVPAHMAHLVDVDIIEDLQMRFSKEFEETSANKIRSTSDMQFAFSFFYFLMSEKEIFSMANIFDKYDTDSSGTWSDREIRTVLSQLYDLPITYDTVVNLEDIILNCSNGFAKEVLQAVVTPRLERYLDSKLPTVTKDLITNCTVLSDLFQSKSKKRKKYKYEIVGEEEIAFKMIKTNVSHVIAQLDDVRKNPRKFICLNDDIDHGKPDAEMVKTLLIDFYESFYPIPSQFELSREFRNRFSTVTELKEWRRHRDSIKIRTYSSFVVIVILIFVIFFHSLVMNFFRWFKPKGKVKCKNKKLVSV